MKTLDEVIDAMERCSIPHYFDCKGCPYENISYPTEIGNTCKDIMHYDALYYMQDRIDECQEANPALTWDELRTMEGKPVWVEWSSDGQWVLIAYMVDNDIKFFRYCDDRSFTLTRDEYAPDKWQAFRKERE